MRNHRPLPVHGDGKGTATERDDWAERLAKCLRDYHDAICNEPIPERLRDLVAQLERGPSAPPGAPLDRSMTAPQKDDINAPSLAPQNKCSSDSFSGRDPR
jgi:hypothetical protein